MGAFQAHIIGRKKQSFIDKALRLPVILLEGTMEQSHIRLVEIVLGEFSFFSNSQISISNIV
jgi:hypothetical protein